MRCRSRRAAGGFACAGRHAAMLALLVSAMLAGCGGGEPRGGAIPARSAEAPVPSLPQPLTSFHAGAAAQGWTAGQSTPLAADRAALLALAVGDRWRMTLPGWGEVVLTVQQREQPLLGRVTTLSGTVQASGDRSAQGRYALAIAGDAVSGRIDIAGLGWRIGPQGGQLLLTLEDARREAPFHAPADAPRRTVTDPLPAPRAAAPPAAQQTRASAAQPAVIDLLATSDQGYRRWIGNESAALADIGALVALTNQALVDSQAHLRFRLAGYSPIDADWSALADQSWTAALRALRDDGLWPQRVGSGADVLLMMNGPGAGRSYCGFGYYGVSASSGSTTAIRPNGLGAAAVGRGSSAAGTCSDLVFAHELGHVLGAQHDRANAQGEPVLPWGYGWGVSGVFGDIMSYIRPRLPYFANPRIRLCAEQPCGTAEADVVRLFNDTADALAATADADNRLSGWYWDPDAPGTGWAVEGAGGKLFVAAFVYRDDGEPTWVAGGGTRCADDPGSFCVGLDEYAGGQTLTGPWRQNRVVRRLSDARLRFSDGFPARLTVHLGVATRQLQRFRFQEPGWDRRPQRPGNALPGWYWNANQPGTGIFVERQGDVIFAASFHYRADGSPTWAIVSGRNYQTEFLPDGTIRWDARTLRFETYAGGQTLTGPWRTNRLVNGNEAQTYLTVDTGYFTAWNAAGSRNAERWSKFVF